MPRNPTNPNPPTTPLPPDLAQHAAQLLNGTGITPIQALDLARGSHPTTGAGAACPATRAATALGDGWSAAQGLPWPHAAASSTVEWYDLGQRLYAHSTRTAANRLVRAPIPHVPHPIAIRASQRGHTTTITLTAPDPTSGPSSTTTETAAGSDALDLLYRHGVRITASTWRTLVTDDTRTIPALQRLARSAPRDGDHADTAAHLAWWIDRADFPGTSAVVDLIHACSTRWVTGSAPQTDRASETWRHWLGTPHGQGAATLDMLAVLDHVQAGPCLNGLDKITEDDAWSWRRAQNDHTDGLNWRTPDPVSRAASGLRARCDIAELYAAALLTDPLQRRRAIHSGHVATGIAILDRQNARSMSIACDRLDARLRANDTVIGWIGPPDGPTSPRWNGTVTSTSVVGNNLIISLTVVATQRPSDGDSVTVMPAPPNPMTIRTGQSLYRRLYGTRRSWLTTGRPPTISRRDVPLDVLFSGR